MKLVRSLSFMVLLSGILSSVPSQAEVSSETQAWTPIFVQGQLASDLKLNLEFQPRLNADGMSRLILRPALMYGLAGGWSAGGGYGAIGKYSGGDVAWEHRLFEQAVHEAQFSFFKWTNRSRFEQRFLPDAESVSLRWRQQTKASIPLGDGAPWSVVLWDEVFFHLNTVESQSIQTGLDQNRAFIGLGLTASDKIRWEFGYLNNFILSTSDSKPSALNHVASITLTVTP